MRLPVCGKVFARRSRTKWFSADQVAIMALRKPSLDEVFLVLTDPDRDHPSGDSAVQQR